MRRMCADDESLFCSLYTDPETMRFIGEPLAPERAARSFRKLLASGSQLPLERALMMLVEQATGSTLGICGITGFAADMSRAEVGIVLKSDARANGYAREGLGGLVRKTFSVFPLNDIWVQCSAMNPVVERMVGSVGFLLCESDPIAPGPLLQRRWSISRSTVSCTDINSLSEMGHV